MSGQAALDSNADLRALLADPASAARSPRLGASAARIRLAVAVADAAQLAAFALLLRALAPGVTAFLSAAEAAALGLLAAMIAAPVRYALRIALAADPEPPLSAALRAAAATAIALGEMAGLGWLALSRTEVPSPDLALWYAGWAVCAVWGAAGLRLGAARLGEALTLGRRVLVLGAPAEAEPLARSIAEAGPQGWRLAGCIDDRDPGAPSRLQRLVEGGAVDVVALAMAGPQAAARSDAVREWIADQPVRVCQALDATARTRLPNGLSHVGRFALLELLADPHGGLDGAMKRALDVAIAGALLVFLAPLLLLVAAAIRLESPGPVLFRQWRFGLANRPMQVFKFRTMRHEACDETGARRTTARDPRVTPLGRVLRRTSIDELPQLLNVLRGEMSLVGPRPHPLHMRIGDAYYFEAVRHYRLRHLVKPGVTGWAQINGSRGEVDTLEKARRRVELDLWYVRNWSLVLDVRILLCTAMGRFMTRDAD